MRLKVPHYQSAFTLVEVLAVIGIMAILGAFLLSVLWKLPGAADRAKCSANLRNLYLALDTYTQEQKYWPQQPDFSIKEHKKYEDWWLRTLAPYGMTQQTWQCPGILRLGGIRADGTSPRIHYTPTMFDAQPQRPYQWPNMPWAVEIANVHGRGALVVMPDGSVRDMDDVIADAQ